MGGRIGRNRSRSKDPFYKNVSQLATEKSKHIPRDGLSSYARGEEYYDDPPMEHFYGPKPLRTRGNLGGRYAQGEFYYA